MLSTKQKIGLFASTLAFDSNPKRKRGNCRSPRFLGLLPIAF